MGVTIKQIALEVGLSWPSVSRILNKRGRFSDETRERVFSAAAKHGYRPNSSARALRDQSSKLVAVLFRNDANNPMHNLAGYENLLGINQRLQETDYATLLIRAGEIARSDHTEPRVFRERLVDGVIVVGAIPEPLIERVRMLSQRLIWLDGPVWDAACCLRRDECTAGELPVRAAADLGYRSVVFVARDAGRLLTNPHHSHPSRLNTARATAQALHLKFSMLNWPEENSPDEYTALLELMKPDVCILAGSLPVARRIALHATSIGKSFGLDYGMVCCDDSYDTEISWPQPQSRAVRPLWARPESRGHDAPTARNA